jgi:hypothetical protein
LTKSPNSSAAPNTSRAALLKRIIAFATRSRRIPGRRAAGSTPRSRYGTSLPQTAIRYQDKGSQSSGFRRDPRGGVCCREGVRRRSCPPGWHRSCGWTGGCRRRQSRRG